MASELRETIPTFGEQPEAAGKDERSKDYAGQWIKYMDSELERQQALLNEDAALDAAINAEAEPDQPAEDAAEAEAEGAGDKAAEDPGADTRG